MSAFLPLNQERWSVAVPAVEPAFRDAAGGRGRRPSQPAGTARGARAGASGLLIATAPQGALLGFGQRGWMAVGVSAVSLCVLWTFGRSTLPLRAVHPTGLSGALNGIPLPFVPRRKAMQSLLAQAPASNAA